MKILVMFLCLMTCGAAIITTAQGADKRYDVTEGGEKNALFLHNDAAPLGITAYVTNEAGLADDKKKCITSANVDNKSWSTPPTYVTSSSTKLVQNPNPRLFAVVFSGAVGPNIKLTGGNDAPGEVIVFKINGLLQGNYSLLPNQMFCLEGTVNNEIFTTRIGAEPTLSKWSSRESDLNKEAKTLSVCDGGANSWNPTPNLYHIEAKSVLDAEKNATAELYVIKLTLTSPDNSIKRINMSPVKMPEVKAEVTVIPNNIPNLKVKFTIDAPEYSDGPNYTSKTKIISNVIDGNSWDIDFGEEVYGGHFKKITVDIWSGNKYIGKTIFDTDYRITGDSLLDNIRIPYINGLNFPLGIKKITKVISEHESFGGTQFWPAGNLAMKGATSFERYPLKSDDGGYGVMQLTNANFLNTETVWNWEANIKTGAVILQNYYNAAKNFLATRVADKDITDNMIHLETYTRFNAGANAKYHFWNVVTGKWEPYNYIKCPRNDAHSSHGATHGYRDTNKDGVADDGWDVTNCRPRGELYADQCLAKE